MCNAGFDRYKYWDAVENSRKKVSFAEIDLSSRSIQEKQLLIQKSN